MENKKTLLDRIANQIRTTKARKDKMPEDNYIMPIQVYESRKIMTLYEKDPVSNMLLRNLPSLTVLSKSIQSPFVVNDGLVELSFKLREKREESTCDNLVEWISKNITEKRGKIIKNSVEVYKSRSGIGIEKDYLFVTLSRLAGLRSQIVGMCEKRSNYDYVISNGSAVKFSDERVMFIDFSGRREYGLPTNVKVISDFEVINDFQRRRTENLLSKIKEW